MGEPSVSSAIPATYGGLVFFGCLKTGDSTPWRGSMRVVRAGSGTIHGNSSAPAPFDPLRLFESGEIVIDSVFRICVEVVLGVRDLTVWGVEPKIPGWRPRWLVTAKVNNGGSIRKSCTMIYQGKDVGRVVYICCSYSKNCKS